VTLFSPPQRAQALNSNTPEVEKKKKKLPHMVNLHKDKLMSECLSYFFPEGKIRLCTKAIDPPPTEDDIILSGLQIKADHATAENVGQSVFLTPGEGARVFVNGKLIKERTEVNHNDRIICGAHLVFRMIFPNHATDDQDSIFDWEYANKELTTSTIEALNKPYVAHLPAADRAHNITGPNRHASSAHAHTCSSSLI
jgi:kinesin family protein 14